MIFNRSIFKCVPGCGLLFHCYFIVIMFGDLWIAVSLMIFNRSSYFSSVCQAVVTVSLLFHCYFGEFWIAVSLMIFNRSIFQVCARLWLLFHCYFFLYFCKVPSYIQLMQNIITVESPQLKGWWWDIAMGFFVQESNNSETDHMLPS